LVSKPAQLLELLREQAHTHLVLSLPHIGSASW
jgi:hypothetical protein